MTITRGAQKSGVKIVLYGLEGTGKTTFFSHAEDAVFIDTEGGTKFLDIARVDGITGWADILKTVDYFLQHPGELKTLVIDTMDWAENMAIRYVCQEETDKNGNVREWDSIETPGYGKGYTYLKQAVQKLLEKLTKLTEKGVNVAIIAHSIVRKFEQPDEMGSYDRYTLKLNEKNVAPIVKEWADALLFVNYRTDVVKSADGKATKARGGQKRVMYANHTAAFDAKNRFGLPDEMAFDFELIRPILDRAGADPRDEPKPEPPRTVPKAEVTTAAQVPAKAGKKAKEAAPKPERPDSMRSDNPAKDEALAKLWEMMLESGVEDPLVLMATVAEKDYYDITVQIRDYDLDFILDVLIDAWDQVNELCQTKIHDLPF